MKRAFSGKENQNAFAIRPPSKAMKKLKLKNKGDSFPISKSVYSLSFTKRRHLLTRTTETLSKKFSPNHGMAQESSFQDKKNASWRLTVNHPKYALPQHRVGLGYGLTDNSPADRKSSSWAGSVPPRISTGGFTRSLMEMCCSRHKRTSPSSDTTFLHPSPVKRINMVIQMVGRC